MWRLTCPCAAAGRVTNTWSESRGVRADAIQSAFMYYNDDQIFNSGKCIKCLSKVILQYEDLPKSVMKEQVFFLFNLV